MYIAVVFEPTAWLAWSLPSNSVLKTLIFVTDTRAIVREWLRIAIYSIGALEAWKRRTG